jgi:hypothetical protein
MATLRRPLQIVLATARVSVGPLVGTVTLGRFTVLMRSSRLEPVPCVVIVRRRDGRRGAGEAFHASVLNLG